MKELTEYHFPEDLKTMTPHEMELLACAIREFLINKVSETGGHLASNLGIVELSLALHRVLTARKTRLSGMWDISHMSIRFSPAGQISLTVCVSLGD